MPSGYGVRGAGSGRIRTHQAGRGGGVAGGADTPAAGQSNAVKWAIKLHYVIVSAIRNH